MGRKKWTAREEVTPALLSFREKKKWQITFRRYVLEKMPCPTYAPYFGLDIASIRKWFEAQFSSRQSWQSFGKDWQFEHIVPVTFFDHSSEEDLRLCWNFTNVRVGAIRETISHTGALDILGAKSYFSKLSKLTEYGICKKMLAKLEKIEASELESSAPLQKFIRDHSTYLSSVEDYSAFEFELLNSARPIEEVKKEIDLFRQMGGRE